jgi:hypothetical protein
LRRVSYGKQGRDFINNWVKIEYDEKGSTHVAFLPMVVHMDGTECSGVRSKCLKR